MKLSGLRYFMLLMAAFLVGAAGNAPAETLSVPTPCFDVNVAIDIQYVLEVRTIFEGQTTLIDRGPFPNAIRSTLCGIGDWVVETRTGAECVEIDELGQRRATGLPCVWDDWIETMAATITKIVSPFPPTFVVKLDPVRED